MELGKVSPPESSGLLERRRLFSRLDQARKGSLAWITGPAGAGKTSLVSSWAQSRDIPAVWYQLDEDDNDPATFFHYMALAHGRNHALPQFARDPFASPASFARRFFSRMFQDWSTPKILVLDNYHLLTGNTALHHAIVAALELLPTDSLVVIASRRVAPAALAHRYAYAGTTHIGWDELRFTAEESRELGRLWGVPDRLAAAMHVASDGWAAIQVLLMRLGGEDWPRLRPANIKSVFDFLNSEFFGKLPGPERAFLVKAAIPPFFSANMAGKLGELDQAEAILERISEEHLLLSRHSQALKENQTAYQFHPIMREFLLQHLYLNHSAEDVRQTEIHVAWLLLEENEAEAAAELLYQARAWEALAQIIRDQAPDLVASGRIALLKQWLDWLPVDLAGSETDYVRQLILGGEPLPDLIASEPWLWPIRVYTLGRFSLLIDDAPLTVNGKAQKKPLQLLKALIALGGRGVAAHALAAVLWEDGEGNPRHALDMAISRLRKLLVHENAVLLQDGKLSLNDKRVWVDAQAFERCVGAFETLSGATQHEEKLAKAKQAFRHYRGLFLAGDEETAWLLGRRDRLHGRFLCLVESYGEALQQAGQSVDAAACYQHALEIDPLAENICQQLMRLHLAQGEKAQTLEVYRRCRHMLSVVLGVAPSPKTESLAASARQP